MSRRVAWAIAVPVVISLLPVSIALAGFAEKYSILNYKLASMATGATHQSHGIADLNGGNPEVIAIHANNTNMGIFDGVDGHTLFGLETGGLAIEHIEFADMDGDGLLDIVVSSTGKVWVVGWVGPPVAVGAGTVPSESLIGRLRPNPTSAGAQLEFTTVLGGNVSLEIFDVSGRKVKVIESHQVPAGSQWVVWDGSDESGRTVGAGTYFYRLLVDGDVLGTDKAVVLR